MTESPLCDGALADLLRAHAPGALADGDFVARTLAAVDRATPRTMPDRAASPREIAQALAAARRRGALLARLRRWGLAGVMAGVLLLALALLAAPAGPDVGAIAFSASVLVTLWFALLAGATWIAWRELAAA